MSTHEKDPVEVDEAPAVAAELERTTDDEQPAAFESNRRREELFAELFKLRNEGVKFRMPQKRSSIDSIEAALQKARAEQRRGEVAKTRPAKKRDTPPPPPEPASVDKTESAPGGSLVHLAYYMTMALVGDAAPSFGFPEFQALGYAAEARSAQLDPLLSRIAKKYGLEGGLADAPPELMLALSTGVLAGSCYCAAHQGDQYARGTVIALASLSGTQPLSAKQLSDATSNAE